MTEQGSESEEEEEEETAPEKRLRLAKQYLSQLEEEGLVAFEYHNLPKISPLPPPPPLFSKNFL